MEPGTKRKAMPEPRLVEIHIHVVVSDNPSVHISLVMHINLAMLNERAFYDMRVEMTDAAVVGTIHRGRRVFHWRAHRFDSWCWLTPGGGRASLPTALAPVTPIGRL